MKNWLNKPLNSLFAPATSSTANRTQTMVPVGTLSASRVTPGEKIDAVNPIARADRNTHRLSITDYRYAQDADELLKTLSKIDPDVSAGIWNFLRLANSGLKCTAITDKHQPDDKLQRTLDLILFRFSGLDNFKDWAVHKPINQVASTIIKYILLRGGAGLELVLNQARTAQTFVIVDPIKVRFKHPKLGQFKPYQVDNNGKEINLDIPTFFWGLLDPDADSPYETPPFLPVIQAVLFNISVMQDLERVVKRVAYPRISVKIIEQTLRKFAPLAAQADDEAMTKWLRAQKTEISASLSNIAPEDAAVFFDSIEVDVLETKGNTTVDFRPLKEVIDQRIIAGLKSLPTILGRQFGSSQTLSGVEALLYSKSIISLQEIAAHMLSRALTLALRLEGSNGFVRVSFNPVNLKPENELEAYKALQQSRILELLSLGLITDEEATETLTGSPTLPNGYKRLSGTGFYKQDKATVDAQAVIATRNPTASEQAGGSRAKNA